MMISITTIYINLDSGTMDSNLTKWIIDNWMYVIRFLHGTETYMFNSFSKTNTNNFSRTKTPVDLVYQPHNITRKRTNEMKKKNSHFVMHGTKRKEMNVSYMLSGKREKKEELLYSSKRLWIPRNVLNLLTLILLNINESKTTGTRNNTIRKKERKTELFIFN